MPEFVCRIAGPSGEVFEKTFVAESESWLRRDLENQDMMILDLRRRSAFAADLARMFRLRGRVSMRDFLLFNQELVALVKSGMPIVEILDILLDRRANETLKVALIDVRDRVKGGESLSEAFAAQGDLFPPLYSASLASGERSGELPTVLDRYIEYTETVLAIRSKVIQSLVYPAVLLTLLSSLVVLMVFFIIPRFEEFLTGFGRELPLLTRAVLGVSDFAVGNWYFIVGGAAALTVGYLSWKRTPSGRLRIDRAKMRLPLVGRVVSDYAQNRFTRTLSTLTAGGIPLVTSLELSARAVGSPVYEAALMDVARQVREGRSLHESLDDTGLLSPIAVQMVRVGESTGALEEMLNNVSDFTDREIANRLARLVTLIEPLMLVFMAVIVATMLLSVYLPMIELYGSAGVGG